jgi:twitching motility protein PilT
MIAAFEVLVGTGAVRNLIREGKTNQLRNIMVTGQHEGMVTLEMSLGQLVRSETVSFEDAMAASVHMKDLARAMGPSLVPVSR